jgi:hypothetical protein
MQRISAAAAAQRKENALKREHLHPLSRSDIQYDFLECIFSNTQAVFIDSYQTLNKDPPGTKVTFRDAYVNSIVHSPRAPKQLLDYMRDSPEFATDFAKLALIVNVGRTDGNMACKCAPSSPSSPWTLGPCPVSLAWRHTHSYHIKSSQNCVPPARRTIQYRRCRTRMETSTMCNASELSLDPVVSLTARRYLRILIKSWLLQSVLAISHIFL